MAVPAPKYFLLDSSANVSSYNAIISALSTYDAQYFNFTPVQVIRPAAHDSSLKLVKSFVTDAELNADADLSALRTANYSNAKCRLKFSNLDNFRIRGFHVLGESEKGTGSEERGLAGRNHYYIRQRTRASASTAVSGNGDISAPGYGDKSGLTHADALDCFKDTVWASGNTYSLCGALIRDRVEIASSANGTEDMKPFPPGDYEANPIIIRCDYEYDKGMLCCKLQDNNTSGSWKYVAWRQACAASNPNVWTRLGGAGGNIAGLFVNVTANTSAVLNNHILSTVSATADVFSRDWCQWYNSSRNETWINIANGDNPHRRVGWAIAGGGWNNFADLVCDGSAANRRKGLHFINPNIVNTGGFGGTGFPKGKFLGGRWLWDSAMFMQGIASGTTFGWSEDGEIPFDTSDRPDYQADEYILKARAKATAQGVSAEGWANMSRFMELNGAHAGIYEFGGWPTSADGVTIRGLLGQNIGSWVVPDKRISEVTPSGDGHIVANQGGSNWDCSYLYLRQLATPASAVKGPFDFYAVTDGNVAQDINNTHIHHFAMASGGIALNGDGGTYPRSGGNVRGNGDYNNNIIEYGCIADASASTQALGSPPIPSLKSAMFINQEASGAHLIRDVHFARVGSVLEGQRNADASMGQGGVGNPAHGRYVGDRWRLERCTFDNWNSRIIFMRELNWNHAPVKVCGISNSNPCIVSASCQSNMPTLGVSAIVHPEVYFRQMSAGMTELDHNIYKAQKINDNSFMLLDLDGVTVDSTGFGTFTSGVYGRAQGGYFQMVSCTYVKTGMTTANTTVHRSALGDVTMAALQTFNSGAANERRDLPASEFLLLDSFSSIVAS